MKVLVMIPAIGFDSKELTRKSILATNEEIKGFFSSLGISVEIFDLTQFNREYSKAISTVMAEIGVEKRREVAKFFYLCKLLGGIDEATEFSKKFIEIIKKYILNVHVYFTIIRPSNFPAIYMYHLDQRPGSKPTIEFLRSLTPTYVHLCAWKYCHINQEPVPNILMDHFQGENTFAWSDLWYKKPLIYCRGDSCNPLISTADMIGGVIDQELTGEKISGPSIKKVINRLDLRGGEIFIGALDFKWIVPSQRKQINCNRLLKHPIYFLITEKRPESLEYKEARDQLELSPIYDNIVNAAYAHNGAIKLYDINQDYPIINPSSDRIIYFGERGEEIANTLTSQYGMQSLHAKYDKIS